MSEEAKLNEDVEVWRRIPNDYYSPSIHVTKNGGVGINVGGHVIVQPIEKWHQQAIGAYQNECHFERLIPENPRKLRQWFPESKPRKSLLRRFIDSIRCKRR